MGRSIHGAMVCGVGLVVALGAHADSLLSQHSANGPLISAEVVRAGFYGATTDDTVAFGPFYEPPPLAWPAVSEGDEQQAVARAGRFPELGVGVVNGGTDTTLTFGGPSGTMDTLLFHTSAAVSSLSGADSSGEAQDATFQVAGSMEFYIDTLFGGASAGDFVGNFRMDSTDISVVTEDPLDPGVSTYFGIAVWELIAEPAPPMPYALIGTTDGSSGLDIDLYAGRFYRIDYIYGMTVPHGIDPVVEVNALGTFTPVVPVPEPATLTLLGMGTLGVARRMRNRSTSR